MDQGLAFAQEAAARPASPPAPLTAAAVRARHAASLDAVQKLTSRYRAHEAPARYDEATVTAFNATYLTLNYDKYVEVVLAAALENPDRMLDIGAGGGAFAIAALHGNLDGTPMPLRHTRSVTLLDRSDAHLKVGTALVSDLQRYDGGREPTEVVSTVEDAVAFRVPKARRVDLVLAGHVLSENRRCLPQVLATARRAMTPDGALLVVEQDDDPVWAALPDAATRAGLRMQGPRDVEVVTDDRPGHARWALLRKPKAWRRALVDEYFAAWSTQSPAALARVFTPDAYYSERPFHPPMRGLERIERYWREAVVPQTAPRPRALNVAYNGDEVLVEWVTTLGRDVPGKGSVATTVAGVLVLSVDRKRRLATGLREYFRTQDVAAGT